MLQELRANEWLSQSGDGSERDVGLPLPVDGFVSIEVRSAEGVVISAMDAEGELLYLASGPLAGFRGRLSGFVKLVISSSGAFRYRAQAWRRGEEVDPVPVVVDAVISAEDAQRQVVREEIERLLRRSRILQEEGVSADDLIDEAEEDFNLEDEEDLITDYEYGLMPKEESRAAPERPEQAPQEGAEDVPATGVVPPQRKGKKAAETPPEPNPELPPDPRAE